MTESTYATAMSGMDSMMTRREFIAIVFMRKWSIIALFLATVAAAAFVTLLLISPNYEAKAKLIINVSDLFVPLADAPPVSDFEKLTSFHTQKDVLTSSTLAARVVDELNLTERRVIGNTELIRIWIRDWRRWVGHLIGYERWQREEDYRAAAVGFLLDRLTVAGSPDSRALELVYVAKHPGEAAETLNTLIDVYKGYFDDEVRQRAQGLFDYLEARVSVARRDLESIERKLLDFKKRDVLEIDTADGDNSLSLTGVTDAQDIQSEIKLYLLKMEEQLRVRLNEVAPTDPSVQRLRRNIQAYTEVLNKLPDRELELLRLGRALELAEENYAAMHRNLARARMVTEGNTSDINIINVLEPAIAPDSATSPKPRLTIALAAVFGVVFGLIFALFMHYLDHTVRSVRDVEAYLGLPTLGSLPRF